MDPFALIMLGGVGGMFIALYLLGRFYPGSGTDAIRWQPTRTPEQEIQNEIDDLDQMLEAANRRRRAAGRPELTEDSLTADVQHATAENVKRRDEYLADLEVVQMLDIKNKRRAKKGLPALTVEDYKASLEDRA
jgi:hypothetical protein